MKHDILLDVATGMAADTRIWKNKKMLWSELAQRLSESVQTSETIKEYLAASKSEQSKIKDVGGYVGGYLRAGRRKPKNVTHRQLLTLDLDFAHLDFWDDFTMFYDNAAVLHSTHKHRDTSPRYRLIIPLNRDVSPEEYEAIARRVAGTLGIDLFDTTTFEVNRLMFWPSNPSDTPYYYQVQDGPFMDADELLATYVDWRDATAWPMAASQLDKVRANAEKQEDPETKRGVIGAFCRAYSISEAIDQFLSDVYTPAGEDRYTYSQGSTAGGLVIYDDKFAFSHHGTDPCSGKLCNAFDLVRIHKFIVDDEEDESRAHRKSMAAMEDFATKDSRVKKVIGLDKLGAARFDFAEGFEETPSISDEEDEEEALAEWVEELAIDSKGNYLSTSSNLSLIFKHDPNLKGVFCKNLFNNRVYLKKNAPWRIVTDKDRQIKNVDYAGVRSYIEAQYGIASSGKIMDAFELSMDINSWHPICEYLKGLEWDGKPRIDTLLQTLFGVKDSLYVREAMRKTLTGAVARVFNPGCKFELVLTLTSEMQGTGKSSFFKALGKEWFSDSFHTVQGKESYEQVQSGWIIEMAELAGIRRAEVEATKQFISKQEDTFRPAYGRIAETFKRQCIFVATTNELDFLKDSTGNRRFLPIEVQPIKIRENKPLLEFTESPEIVDQIWAEAYQLYKNGETLYLSTEADRQAEVIQKYHSEVDDRQGMIIAYLERLLPEDWDELDLYERRDFLNDPLAVGTVQRDSVCNIEIWCECLGKEKKDADRYKTREIGQILRAIGWVAVNSTKSFGTYGQHRYFERPLY